MGCLRWGGCDSGSLLYIMCDPVGPMLVQVWALTLEPLCGVALTLSPLCTEWAFRGAKVGSIGALFLVPLCGVAVTPDPFCAVCVIFWV